MLYWGSDLFLFLFLNMASSNKWPWCEGVCVCVRAHFYRFLFTLVFFISCIRWYQIRNPASQFLDIMLQCGIFNRKVFLILLISCTIYFKNKYCISNHQELLPFTRVTSLLQVVFSLFFPLVRGLFLKTVTSLSYL